MKKSILFLSAAVTLLATAACQNFKKGDGGLEYKIVKDEGAEKAKAGDLLSVDMTVTSDRKDSLLQSTYDIGLPQIINIAPDSIPGLYAGDYNSMFKFLGEGDSAVFRLNLDTMAAKTGQPKPEFADKFVTFTVKVRKHFKKGNLTDSALYAQIDTYFKGEIEGLKKSEEGKLAKYVADKKLEPKKSASGLQYIISQEGKGDKVVVGDTVVVNYTGKLVNGKVFDTNSAETAKKEKTFNPMKQYEPIRFRVGHDPVIQGWTEGMQLLNKGAKATFLVPSNLGYGERGGGTIPPYAPLVFEVEVVNIIPGPKGDAPAATLPVDSAATKK
ncbi:peptidylprolyl isomerase [Sphingobacterium psychroaquaticum]|uniref:FKBP-type peptidyl-prolyl cis-trans isomerase n=1 Tax=Sphingobacterium psychroaquaticum TaxID=561061 RepID=UPI00106A6D59|nr:FKBP-type peptidyl-prolyl cis-trans isomerase [Sphingobacterium psychroaquaticum]QBQ40152.1 peptidylprolyl isomerase [Sphingobacterium psychroaquaticum]